MIKNGLLLLGEVKKLTLSSHSRCCTSLDMLSEEEEEEEKHLNYTR